MTWFQIIKAVLYHIKRCVLSNSVLTYFNHVGGMLMYVGACVIGASLATIIMQSVLVR
jgi:hypothetical protein